MLRGGRCRKRNQIGRFFSNSKHFRRVATRYEKYAGNYRAMLKLAPTNRWLRHYESLT